MARIEIENREADGEDFPRMCIYCGRETENLVPHTFSWMPPWVNICIFAGLLPWIIVMLVVRKTMRVRVPLCQRHTNHWALRSQYVWVGLGVWFLLFCSFGVFHDSLPEGFFTPVLAALLVGVFFWLVAGLIFASSAIRASEIDDFGADITNVNREFAREWRDHCDELQRKRKLQKKRRRSRKHRYDDDEDDDYY